MFTYFPKLSRSDATPAGDQSLLGVLQINMVSFVEINGPYFFEMAPFFSQTGAKGPQ